MSEITIRARARVRPVTRSYDELLELVREKAPDPTVFDTRNPMFWDARVSNNKIDFYGTSMAKPSLSNYVDDLTDGVSYQNSHKWMQNGWGQSILGELVETGSEKVEHVGDPLREVYGTFFTLPGLSIEGQNTDQFIDNIRSGLWRDVSIGFYARDITCSICGKQVWDFFAEDMCPHLPGEEYDGELMWASVNDGRMLEVSQVYDGATPDAEVNQVVIKAETMAEERMISEREIASVEQRFHTRVARPAKMHAVPDVSKNVYASKGSSATVRHKDSILVDGQWYVVAGQEDRMSVRDKSEEQEQPVEAEEEKVTPESVEGERVREGEESPDEEESVTDEGVIPDETVISFEDEEEDGEEDEEDDDEQDEDDGVERLMKNDPLRDERLRLAGTGIELGRNPVAAVRSLSDALLEARRQNANLEAEAKIGRQYRDDMVAEALKEGVRARGNSFKRDVYEKIMSRMGLDEIQVLRDDFAQEAREVLKRTPPVNISDEATEEKRTARRRPGAHVG